MFLEEKKQGEVNKFLTAKVLGISQHQHDTLVEVMDLLENETIPEDSFGMRQVGIASTSVALGCPPSRISSKPRFETFHCGTPRCILGWCFTISKYPEVWFGRDVTGGGLNSLFYPYETTKGWDATRLEAAHAIRNYLTTGRANWRQVMGEK